MHHPEPPLRLAELVATLSIATDLGTGHPMERALRACLFAVRLGEECGYGEDDLTDIYYTTLLRFAGCAADARHRASLFGDEIALGPEIDAVELWQVEPMLAFLRRHGFGRLPPDEFQALMATGIQRSIEAATANCEVGQSVAARLGLDPQVIAALGDVFERWDGQGVPGRVSGEAIALPARVAALALDAELYYRIGGVDAVRGLVRQRAGGQYDPALAGRVLARPGLCASFAEDSAWEAALAYEPGPRPTLTGTGVDEAIRAIADFTDLRTPFMSGHSSAVAELCVDAARRLRLAEADVTTLRRAAYVHDVGMAAISVGVWEMAGPLSAGAWEQVRLHPYYTERVMSRAPALRPVGQVAGLHHERHDGSGYHRQLAAPLPVAAGILAAAEIYRGMVEDRPQRAALPAERAAEALRAQGRAGSLAPDCIEAVLDAAGHPAPARPAARPAGLTARELEVLALVARGLTNRQIAESLVVAPATVDHHLRHIFAKIGCSTRLAATMFAMEHRLVRL